MDHTQAKEIFEEIQSRPFNVSVTPGIPSNNCYHKGSELIRRLGVLGYAVRGRIGESYLDTKIMPAEIVNLLPADLPVTHFFPEVLIDNQWRIVDPTFQPLLAKYGFLIGSWEGSEPCFPITKLYTQEESMAYQKICFDPEYQRDYFARGQKCWQALNEWFATLS